MSSVSSVQEVEMRQTPSLLLDQLLHRASDRYLPEIIWACTVAMETLAGDEPAVVYSTLLYLLYSILIVMTAG